MDIHYFIIKTAYFREVMFIRAVGKLSSCVSRVIPAIVPKGVFASSGDEE